MFTAFHIWFKQLIAGPVRSGFRVSREFATGAVQKVKETPAAFQRRKTKAFEWIEGGPPEGAACFKQVQAKEQEEITRLRALRIIDLTLSAFETPVVNTEWAEKAGMLRQSFGNSPLEECYESYMENRSPAARQVFLGQIAAALHRDPELSGRILKDLKCEVSPDLGHVGLALSGGGIRSATFNLGVLQALAKLKLLYKFDYLSTVSGGGYIGSWLAAWIKRRGFAEVNRQLDSDWVAHEGREAPPIQFLRDYSNYLTPRLGALSADTWAMIATYLRNTLLNLTIVIPALAAALLVPRLFALLAPWLGIVGDAAHSLVPFLLLLLASSTIALNLQAVPERAGGGAVPQYPLFACSSRVVWWAIAPVLLAACLLVSSLTKGPQPHYAWWRWALGGALAYFAVWYGGFVISRGRGRRPVSPTEWPGMKFWGAAASSPFVAGAVGGLLFGLLLQVFGGWRNPDTRMWHMITLGPPLMVLVFMAAVMVHVGWLGRQLADELREWLSRAGAWLFILMIAWTGLFGLALYGPLAVVWGMGHIKTALGGIATWLGVTVGGLLAARSAETGKLGSTSNREILARITPFAFLVGLLLGLSFIVNEFLPHLMPGPGTGPTSVGHLTNPESIRLYAAAHWFILKATLEWRLWLWIIACAAAAVIISWRVDLNLFSMHLFYRNRLTRAYLGASNQARTPQPFAGFDPNDDVSLKDLVANPDQKDVELFTGPYPLINTSLNLTHGKRLGWQERKAESFTMTPLSCGFEVSATEDTDACAPDEDLADGGYRSTRRFAYRGGLYLGTAFAISGAAASPNMGYYTSGPVAFLMTVFNVRLGWWLGNPRREDKWWKSSPRIGLPYLIAELLAMTNDRSSYVYLSDGGHFENLGIYELVRRRCRLILVSDATADPDYKFGDLGNAIRKCREDFGVDIKIDLKLLRGRGKPKRTKSHVAIGTIHYENAFGGEKPGVLLYIKASLTKNRDEPADVLEYAGHHTAFPHDTTADQWFGESQFESYRMLGQHILEEAGKDNVLRLISESGEWTGLDAERLKNHLKERFPSLYSPPDASATASGV